MKYLKVFIYNKVSKLNNLYTYYASDKFSLDLGVRVVVPFGKGNRKEIALIVGLSNKFDENYKLKEIIEVIDFVPIVSKELINLGFWMSEKYITSPIKSFAPILPPGNIKKIVNTAEILNYDNLTFEESNLIKELKKNNYNIDFIKSDNEKKTVLRKLIDKNKIKLDFEIETIGGFRFQKYVKLKDDYETLIPNLKLSYKQNLVVDYLRKEGEVLRSDILKNLKISDSPLKSLENKNLISIYDKKKLRERYTEIKEDKIHNLNFEQMKALNSILNSQNQVSLLHGLTGSGKTEVYLKLTEENIRNGGKVIVLVPEIGLTPQMIERFMARFNKRVAVLHSKLSLGERYDAWNMIKNGKVDVVVGVRSAVFAPFSNLSLIIVDEEHDSSYRFHNSLRYDTIEVAKKRAELNNCKLILGSATPSVESYYKASKGEYNLFELNKRAVIGSKLPEIKIVDMREELILGNLSIFSSALKTAIEDKLSKKEQIILFLNRRGFSNFIACRTCGHVIKCDSCDISMTYHKNINMLRCHYCGATKHMVDTCPECGSKFIKQFGIGTQKLEEEVAKYFPYAKVLRMDRDTTNNKASYDEIYKKVKNREIDILIGTQMVAKGLDFENVTLVGVMAADLSLYISDFRANETTFQLLTQVSGRAGRAEKEGCVIIQSYNPDNYAIIDAKEGNYKKFYNREIDLREKFKYPPFRKMINIYLSSNKEEGLENFAYWFLRQISKETRGLDLEVTKPIKVPKINNIYKEKFTIKVPPNYLEKLREILKWVLNNNKKEFDKNNVYVDIEFI
ncbi:MAG: primosomal protein N' [Peptoniphilaceae bacterium]